MRKIIKTKRLFRTLTAGIIAIMIAAGLAGCGSAGTNSASEGGSSQETTEAASSSSNGDTSTIRLGVMTGNIDQQLATIAEEEGFFAENGLEVQVTEYAAGINTVDAITTDQLDIGFVADYAGVNRIGNTSSDTDIRFFANFAASAQTKLYVNPETVSGLEDLAGKGFITLNGTVWDYWTGLTLDKAGLTSDDVNLVQVSSAADALAAASSGGGDAFWASGENAKRLTALGWEPILTQEDLNAVTYQFYMASEGYLSENQSDVEKFLTAIQEASDYIEENTDDAADIVYQKNGMDQDVFKNYVESYTFGVGFPQSALDDLNSINAWAYANGNYDSEYDVSDFVSLDAVKDVFPDATDAELS